MAAATSVTSYVTALGPIKVEFVMCTMASDGDDYVSKLVTPKFAFASLNATSTNNCVTSLSGKTVTVANATISASAVFLIIVGF
jgi:hypothetical protein